MHRRAHLGPLAAGLVSISLAFGLLMPLNHRGVAEPMLDKLLRLNTLIHVTLAKGQHVADDLATLYKIRKLASSAPRRATQPTPDAVGSPKPSPPVEICSGVFEGSAKRSSH